MIDSIKDLEKLLKLLRKQGVSEFEHNGTKLKMGDLPTERQANGEPLEEDVNPYKGFPDGQLTEEQLMYYSAGGSPENDPALKETA